MINHDWSWLIIIDRSWSWSIMIHHDCSWSIMRIDLSLMGDVWSDTIVRETKKGQTHSKIGDKQVRCNACLANPTETQSTSLFIQAWITPRLSSFMECYGCRANILRTNINELSWTRVHTRAELRIWSCIWFTGLLVRGSRPNLDG